ncbi:hypothetical protein [Acinetobacter sp. ANC 4641]|uniref:hypothetical protein n=1 Tax=Acinetobacter sp. ANC 4641 TaxID=2529847 RepID=UPI0010394CB8|nr:hypothetical protein [Acinetobacter sp. ANC 4641]TCB11472.1 hypothetical protein E0H78_07520 [Acinetobacter sp. ANC 4641]
MDIQKQREAFESYAQKFFKTDKAFEKKGNQYIYDEVVMMWDCWITKQLEIDELKAKLAKLDRDADQLLTERDEMQEFAEKLKDRLQEVFNQDFGDHSNANCPFTNALEYNDSSFVLVPKEKLSVFWQDDDEPENIVSDESNFNSLGDCIELGDVMTIKKHTQSNIETETLYGTWEYEKVAGALLKSNFFVGSYKGCLAIVEAAQGEGHE